MEAKKKNENPESCEYFKIFLMTPAVISGRMPQRKIKSMHDISVFSVPVDLQF